MKSLAITFIILLWQLTVTGKFLEAKETKLIQIPDKLVVLTFDDANKSDRIFVSDILKQYGFGATFYVTEGLGFLKNKDHYTTWKQIRELHEMGFEIGNHTQHHRGVSSITGDQLKSSVKHIEKRCAEHGIPNAVTFCYPGFGHTLEAVKAPEEGELAGSSTLEYSDAGEGSPGPAYDPQLDHERFEMGCGSGPRWKNRRSLLSWSSCLGTSMSEHRPQDFKEYIKYLKDQQCTVIAMRDLAKYVDPSVRAQDPYQTIKERTQALRKNR
ncbi:MAG: polysaccharide deacetylase family protein [Pirellulaceae bacterium]|nr:polysaccharide deacetylase family protein [Pirellulaceae bacterium]